jgi:alpha-galactosidase
VPGGLSRTRAQRVAGRIAGAWLAAFLVSFAVALNYTSGAMTRSSVSEAGKLPTAHAPFLKDQLESGGFPAPLSWEKAPAIRFNADWKGERSDPQRETEVRVLWNRETLFLRFVAKYRELNVFPDARPDGWRDQLWDRDVAEAFLQPDDHDAWVYKEFEVSPNGYWIDLNLSHGEKEEMRSGLRRRVALDERAGVWTAELAIPMKSLTPAFDPKKGWRANFYRVEGKAEPRFYAAWSPTMTPEPNFHVPSAFGRLIFRESGE